MTEMTSTEIVRRDAPELDRFARLGQWLAMSESGQADEKSRGASAALRLYYAEQLGLPPTAVAELSVINGRLVLGAQLQRALARRAGFVVRKLEQTDTSCTAALFRMDTGEQLGDAVTFTLEDAQRAGLVRDRSPWKTHPGRMCWARASTLVIRDYAPEVTLGIVLDDEVQEIVGEVIAEADWPPESEAERMAHEAAGIEFDPPKTEAEVAP